MNLKSNTSVSSNEVYGRVSLGSTPGRIPGESFRAKMDRKRPDINKGKSRKSFLNSGKIKRA